MATKKTIQPKKEILTTMRDVKAFVSWARKQKIQGAKLNGFEFTFHAQAFLDKKQTKAFLSLLNPTLADKEREADDDLYHSAI